MFFNGTGFYSWGAVIRPFLFIPSFGVGSKSSLSLLFIKYHDIPHDMADVIEKTKSSFSIGEAAEILTLSVDTLRFYEKTGVIGEIQRDQGGRRSFTQRDLDWLHFVNCLKSTGMSLDLIREYRELMMQGDHTAPRRKELMVQHKILLEKQIGDLNAAMERINYKIDYYDDVLRDQGF